MPNLIDETELIKAREEIAILRAAVAVQCADNLCWMKSPEDFEVGAVLPEAEFLESCRRFHAQQRRDHGDLTVGSATIAQLELEVVQLRYRMEEMKRLELRDKARLDWLEKVGFSTRDIGTGTDGVHSWRLRPEDKWSWTARNISSECKSAREAIDRFMEKTPLP